MEDLRACAAVAEGGDGPTCPGDRDGLWRSRATAWSRKDNGAGRGRPGARLAAAPAQPRKKVVAGRDAELLEATVLVRWCCSGPSGQPARGW